MIKNKIAIICAEFNEEITSVMLESAKKEALRQNLEVVQIIKVPGAFDIPYAAKKVIELKKADGIITLGAVIQGDTDHDIIVADHCARLCADLSVQYTIPIALGVIGPRVTWENAEKRKEEYAIRAIIAVKKLLEL